MKQTPLKRKTPLKQTSTLKRTTKLRAKRSTGKPTKGEAKHIDQIKHGPCVCCWINQYLLGLGRADQDGCDAHHTLSGGRRRGHSATLGLCPWHHRGVRPERFATDAKAIAALGPSLAGGSKPFRAVYGTDDDLMATQRHIAELSTSY